MDKFIRTMILCYLAGLAVGFWCYFPIPMTIGLFIIFLIMNWANIVEFITKK